MLRKLLRSKPSNMFRFAKKESAVVQATASSGAVTKKADPLDLERKEDVNYTDVKEKHVTSGTMWNYLIGGGEIKDVVSFREAKYPNHIEHWNPESKNYVASELDEQDLRVKVDSHNEIVRDFIRDLKLQAKINEIWEKEMNAPKTGVPGVTESLFEEVQNYDRLKHQESFVQMHEDNHVLQQLSNEKIINRSLFIPKQPQMSNMVDWAHELDERPVDVNFHKFKGHKFDVETPYDQRVKHVADRLGHPEIYPYPFETLLRLERIGAHPAFQDQGHFQMPSAEPDSSLNFAAGDVLYSKPSNKDWGKFWMTSLWVNIFYWGAALPFHQFFRSTTPVPSAIEDIGAGFHTQSWTMSEIDYYHIAPLFYVSILGLLGLAANQAAGNIVSAYPSSIQFNETKDLIFVKRVNQQGSEEEKVFEVDHLEIVPPSIFSSLPLFDLSKNGFITLHDLNTRENFVLHNDPKYWNPEVREWFLKKVTKLWDKSMYQNTII